MSTLKCLAQTVEGYVRIELRCSKRCVSEQFLDVPKVCATFEHVRCRTVAKSVWRNLRHVREMSQESLKHGANHSLVDATTT